MQISKKKFIVCLITAALVGSIITSGVLGIKVNLSGGVDDKYAKMERLYQYINSTYYEEADMDVLMEGAYKGFVEALGDPYSSYMTAEEYANWMTNIEGEYSGIGVTFTQDQEGKFIVISVEKESPAEIAGMKSGDIITKVNGKTYDNMELLANDIKGKEGTNVKISYMRDGAETTVEITRKKIVQHSVSHEMIDSKTGYINITSFMDNTYEDFKAALDDVESKGAQKLILDLRDNGGGLLTSCINVADEFLDKGIVVYVEGRDQEKKEYKSKNGKTDLETVVIVNENSASAAEILAAALKDNGFKLVGQTTFGKGVIQSTVELKDGSALKWTIMQYFSPKGNVINKKGVTPEFIIENDDKADKDEQLEKAKELLK
ncbi:MAG: S41 family peptidase [Bacillota bacterium]|nr:S41 family peptidase [Bacillota bacterium]